MKIRNKKGFTLVEMIISLAIISIMMMGMLAFFGPVTTMVGEMKEKTNAETAIVSINTYITKCIRDAKKVAVYQYYKYEELPQMSITPSKVPFSSEKDEVKCLRLAWTKRTGSSYGYILIEEEVDYDNLSNLIIKNSKNYTSDSVPDAKKVFKDGYYKDLNFLFKVNKISVTDDEGKTSDFDYGCALSAVAYRDAALKDQIFSSENTMDYIVFNNMKINKEAFTLTEATYDADSKDIYIFYIVSKPATP